MFERVEKELQKLLKETIEGCPESIVIDIPKEKEFGDLSCNVAMRLASIKRRNPREVASEIVLKLKELLA